MGLVLVAGGAFTAVRAGTPGPAGAAAASAHEDEPALDPHGRPTHSAHAARAPRDPLADPLGDPLAGAALAQMLAPGVGGSAVAASGVVGSGPDDGAARPARPRRSPSIRRNSA